MDRYRVLPLVAAILTAAGIAASTVAEARLVRANLVLKTGDLVGPGTVSSFSNPFTDGGGAVGFVGALSSGERFVYWDNGPIFFSSQALPLVLTGHEATMGVSNAGGFIYSPSVDGNDAVYTQEGVLLKDGDPFPPNPAIFTTFNSRPTMLPDGTCIWVAGSTETQGGSSSNRHVLKATDPGEPSTITRVLGGGDVIEGKTITNTGSLFNYDVSDNAAHHLQVMTMAVPTNQDLHLYRDGAFVAQEGTPTGQGDNWSGFDAVSVNDSGDYVFAGDTDGPTSTDYYLAYNGQIRIREGSTLDGVLLAAGSAMRALSIDNHGDVAFVWGVSSSAEHLFLGTAADLAASENLLSLGDSLDVDGDALWDYTLTDFNPSPSVGPGLDLADDQRAFLNVDIQDPAGASYEAVLWLYTREQSAAGDDALPFGPRLLPNYPNPFSGQTRLEVQLDHGGPVDLAVFDAGGRRVRSLFGGVKSAGRHTLIWDGRDARGVQVPQGVYLIRLRTDGGSSLQKSILTR